MLVVAVLDCVQVAHSEAVGWPCVRYAAARIGGQEPSNGDDDCLLVNH